jgi:sensor histidine kinase regulating citrate/malate metabolism
VGGKFIGDLGDAPQGGVFTQEYTGTQGPSVRAVVPVQEADGEVVASMPPSSASTAIPDPSAWS